MAMEDFHDKFLNEVYNELCDEDGSLPTDALDVAIEALELQDVIGPDELKLELDPKETGQIPKDAFISVLGEYLNPQAENKAEDKDEKTVEITNEIRMAFGWFSSDNKYITREDLVRIGKETKTLSIDATTNEPKDPQLIDKMLSLAGSKDRLTISDFAAIMNEFTQI